MGHYVNWRLTSGGKTGPKCQQYTWVGTVNVTFGTAVPSSGWETSRAHSWTYTATVRRGLGTSRTRESTATATCGRSAPGEASWPGGVRRTNTGRLCPLDCRWDSVDTRWWANRRHPCTASGPDPGTASSPTHRDSWKPFVLRATHTTACNSNHIHTLHANSTPCLRKNVPPLACYNFDAREWILIFFGRNVTDKVGNQKTLYCATANNVCFCTACQNGETRKWHFSLNWIVLHTQCTCALSSWKKKLSCVW